MKTWLSGFWGRNAAAGVWALAAFLVIAAAGRAAACNVLYVVGNTTLSVSDEAVYDLLVSMGVTVSLVSGPASATSNATGKDLVIISASVASSDVNTKFKSVTIPVLNYEPALMDDMAMTGLVNATDYGNAGSLTQILIENANHSMADGLSGTVTVYSSPQSLVWGVPSANAQVVASLTGETTRKTIFGYPAGAQMVGFTAPARRVGVFSDQDGPALFTTQGRSLFKAAANWAMDATLPVVTTQPINKVVAVGATATFSVTASGNFLSYQWKKNGSSIWGANGSSYTTPATTASNNGDVYSVVILNPAGSVTSGNATLNVEYAPAFTSQPGNKSTFTDNTVTFSAAASGNPAPTYQWRKNGTNISGATSASYTTTPAASVDNGAVFSVVATNSRGSATSNNATLTVTTVPVASRPLVELKFDALTDNTTSNTGTESGSAFLTGTFPVLVNNKAPANGSAALDFGGTDGDYGVDYYSTTGLQGLKSFTITGWLNCKALEAVPGGHRVVTWKKSGDAAVEGGVDLAIREGGVLALGVNQWNDPAVAGSSPGKITADAETPFGNWVFFAVTYDGTVTANNVSFYFGSNFSNARLDRTLTHDKGAIWNTTATTLTLGSHVASMRSGNSQYFDRMYHGLMDQIRIYGSKVDNRGVKSLSEITQIQNVSSLAGSQGLTYERWDGLLMANSPNATVTDVLNHPGYPSFPSAKMVRSSFDAPQGQGNNSGARMSGWILAPVSGSYRFWIAADDVAELRLSTDANPDNKQIIASVPSWMEYQAWTSSGPQQSAPVTLEAGKYYYVEALMAQGIGWDHLSVGWELPGGVMERPIPSSRVYQSPPEAGKLFPSVINIYEPGTSTIKASVGWSKETGIDQLYVDTEGQRRMRIIDDAVSATDKLFLGDGTGSIENLGFSYEKTGSPNGLPILMLQTGDGKAAMKVEGRTVGFDLNPVVDFNEQLTISGPATNEEGLDWDEWAYLHYSEGMSFTRVNTGTFSQTTQGSVLTNTGLVVRDDLDSEGGDLKVSTSIVGGLASLLSDDYHSNSVRLTEVRAGSLTLHSGQRDAQDPDQINYSEESTQLSYDKVQSHLIEAVAAEGVPGKVKADVIEASSMVMTPKWKISANFPDYVFEKGYPLKSLEDVERYVKANKHLPEIPSAKEMHEKGLDLAEMNIMLLKKVEELTLHMIDMDKRLKKQATENVRMKQNMRSLKSERSGK